MKGFLFDLDGTLVDTAIDMIGSLKLLAAENNIDIDPDYNQYKELITYGSRAIVESIFGHLDNKSIKNLQQRYLAIYQQNLTTGSGLFAGIEEVIVKLDEACVPWGIVTNKPGYLARPLVDALPQLKHCKILVGGDSTKHSKPHPAPIIYALDAMNLQANISWYIGDAQTDIVAAKAAHMNSAIAMWGYLSVKDQPEKWQADQSLDKSIEILRL